MTFSKHRRLITLILSLAVLFYAIPRLPLTWEVSAPSLFAFSWLSLALLVVAANWRSVLGIDREEAKQLERIRNLKAWQQEEWMRGGRARYPRADRRRAY